MILTKKQIITEIMKKFCPDNTSKHYFRALRRSLAMSDNHFIPTVLNELNWSLEPIRKNTYIVR